MTHVVLLFHDDHVLFMKSIFRNSNATAVVLMDNKSIGNILPSIHHLLATLFILEQRVFVSLQYHGFEKKTGSNIRNKLRHKENVCRG